MWKTIFSTLDKNKRPAEAEINKISSYIFLRWLQNNQVTVQAANQLNYYYDIPMVNQYNLVKQAFGGKNLYIKYPKNTKDEHFVDEIVARHFKINMEKSKEYQEILSEAEINKIVDLYNETKGKR